ncbi:MAG: precorrin-6A reductase [Candidatus Methanoplasma sp.]|jgi:precorrin-6Y C5,15-methyltransferase (decarboxylating)|nr:precorrin-6A reductase [Candidatus Methanoplasma sp.]
MQSRRVIIFAGTTEGRQIAQYLGNAGIDVLACVATEFGRRFIEESGNVKVSSERLGEEGMIRIMKGCSCVIDATHPYAAVITGKIKAACAETGSEYIRLLRKESRKHDGIITVPDVASAVEYLKGTEGNILVTTGGKELERYASIKDHKERVFARVLSMPDASLSCAEKGFQGRNLFCMQGPFCEELNYGMLKQTNAKYLVTKESGEPGGFEEKVRAAERAGAKIVLVSRPEEAEGYGLDELTELLGERFGIGSVRVEKTLPRRRISVIGIGMGNDDTLTVGAAKAIDEADLLIGAERMVRSVSKGQDPFIEYRAEPIISFINEHPEYRRIAILVSGDAGFQSAAKKIEEKIDRSVFDTDIKCGISSVAYLCSRIGSSWDDAFLMSAHGREANVVGAVYRNGKVIVLLDGAEGIRAVCRELAEYEMDHVSVTVGQDLGQTDEKITKGKPSDLMRREFGTLCIAMIENPSPCRISPGGMRDDLFIRGDAPMTKEEIRSLSVIKLKLEEDSVLFDVGAGTGSVAVGSASVMPNGKVYAIEKEKDAADLIRLNKKKFKVPNLEVVEGHAPEALMDLPAPSHVFIGGSSGNLREIMKVCLKKNPEVRFVINAITLETVSEMIGCFSEQDVEEEETISVNISRSKKAGGYHLMTAHNPVYIGVCNGKGR